MWDWRIRLWDSTRSSIIVDSRHVLRTGVKLTICKVPPVFFATDVDNVFCRSGYQLFVHFMP